MIRNDVRADSGLNLSFVSILMAVLLLGSSGYVMAEPKMYFSQSVSPDYYIQRANTDGTSLETVVADDGSVSPKRMVVDTSTNILYYGDSAGPSGAGIYKISLGGTFPTTPVRILAFDFVGGLALDQANGHLYYNTDNAAATVKDYNLYRCNTDGSSPIVVIPDDGVWNSTALWFDKTGGTLFLHDKVSGIRKISISNLPSTTASLTAVHSLPNNNQEISLFGYSGKLYYNDLNAYVVSRVNFDGSGNEVVIADDTTWNPKVVYVDEASGTLYVVDSASTSIRKIAVSALPSGTAGAAALTQVLTQSPVDLLVHNLNDPPAIANLNGDSFTYTEGDVATKIDVGGNATVTDSNSTDFIGGALTVTIAAGEDATEDTLSLDTSLVSLGGTTAGSNVSVGGSFVGTLGNNIAPGNDLVINFITSNATAANTQTLVRAITYQNNDINAPTAGARTVRTTISDGDGATSANADVTVSVAAVNDSPSFNTGASLAAVNEDTALPAGETVTSLLGGKYTDPDTGDNLAGIAVSADASTTGVEGDWQYTTDGSTWYDIGSVSTTSSLLLNVNAKLRFVPFTNYNGTPGSLTVYAVDDSSATTFTSGASRQTFDTTVDDITSKVSAAGVAVGTSITAINDTPIITGQATLTTPSDTAITITLGNLTVTDPDNSYPTGFTLTLQDGVNYSLSGNTLTPALGYVGDLTVPATVNDGTNDSTSFNLLVTVTLGNSAPTISGTPATGVGDDVPYSFVPTAHDVDGDPLTFSILNKPAWASFNTSTGALSGTPTAANIGTTTGIVISVSDDILSDSLVAFDLEVYADLDNDNIADSVDTDDDGDGMSDDWESANGLNPRDASDASGDVDGDSVSNLDEFLASSDPKVDDYPPVVTPPADVTVDAVGLFTAVSTGTSTAVDGLDGSLTPTSDAPTQFAPGAHIVTWSAKDAAGNIGTAIQTVNVVPQVSFSKDQVTAEGGAVKVRLILNGPAVSYPVTTPYTVGGTAATDGSDHTLADGSVVIAAGTEATVSFTTVDDGAGEGTEQIVVTMGTPTNAVPGGTAEHLIDVVEGNVAPVAQLSAEQGSGPTLTVVTGNGPVTVNSTVNDPNVGDVHGYDWSGSDNALSDTDVADDTFTFDPSSLAPGLYTLRLSVSDGSVANDALLSLDVVATAPALSAANDSDGDGANDADEGHGDADGDGVADYLDAIGSSNVLQELSGRSDTFLMEVEPGLLVRLGDIAFRAGLGQAAVTMSDVTNLGGVVADNHRYDGGLFDFIVEQLPVAGQSIRVVLPQQAAIPAAARYRKLINGLWQDFVVDAANSVASAPGEQGYCPPPGDSAYTAGLGEGHWCVQLTLEDGGPNDADGVANNSVADPSGVAAGQAVTVEVDSGGGAASAWLLTILGLLLWRTRLVRREVA